ncbi:MAG: 50S ribosomal protein L35 [bacterium JZ-2024 1]
MGRKMKTHKTAAKRFKITGSGKIVAYKSGKSHLLRKKSSRRKRRLTGIHPVSPAHLPRIRKLLGR